MSDLTIKQTFTVGDRTFDNEADAQAYITVQQRKQKAEQILSAARHLDPRRDGLKVSNRELVSIVADHREAFAEVLAVLNGEVA